MNNLEDLYKAAGSEAADVVSALETKKKAARKRAGRIRKIIIAIIVLILILLLAYCGYEQLRPKSRHELDRNALEGFLPGKTEEEIQAELDRIIDESRFNVTINSLITLRDGKADVRIENVPANNYYMQVDLYVYPETGSTDNPQMIYQSGVIQQGHYIETADAETDLPEGYYDGLAVFHALYPDETMEEIGQTSMNVVIHIEED